MRFRNNECEGLQKVAKQRGTPPHVERNVKRELYFYNYKDRHTFGVMVLHSGVLAA